MKLFDSRAPLLAALLALSIPAPQALAAAPEPEEITNAVLLERMESGFKEARAERESMRRELQAEHASMRREAQAEHASIRREAQAEHASMRRELQAEHASMGKETEARIKGVEGKLDLLVMMFGVLVGAIVAFAVFTVAQLMGIRRDMVDREEFAAMREDYRDLMRHFIPEGARSQGAPSDEARSEGARPERASAAAGASAPEASAAGGYRVQPERHEAGAYGAVGEPEGPPKPRSEG